MLSPHDVTYKCNVCGATNAFCTLCQYGYTTPRHRYYQWLPQYHQRPLCLWRGYAGWKEVDGWSSDVNRPNGGDGLKIRLRRLKWRLIAKEFGDAVAAPSKTSPNWNIRGEPREPREPEPREPQTRDSAASVLLRCHIASAASPTAAASPRRYHRIANSCQSSTAARLPILYKCNVQNPIWTWNLSDWYVTTSQTRLASPCYDSPHLVARRGEPWSSIIHEPRDEAMWARRWRGEASQVSVSITSRPTRLALPHLTSWPSLDFSS